MTREEAIAFLIKDKEQRGDCFISEALEMAIKALKQKPSDDATLKDIFCMGCEYKEQEPKTQMVDKSNFDVEQYKMDLQCAYDCGRASVEPSGDLISRQAAIDAFERFIHELGIKDEPYNYGEMALSAKNVPPVTPQEPKTGQYEKHIDHTDCIWYGSDSGCPVTCSQYRDGWNDAMEYIFEGGKGYQPYRREEV